MARVTAEHRGGFTVVTETGDLLAEVAGRMRHEAASRDQLPAVGDWVAVRPYPGGATIQALLPRKSAFVRNLAGSTTEPQVVAANVDLAIIVCAFGQDMSPRRVERYLAAVRSSGARAILALSKADSLESPEKELGPIREVAGNVPVHLISSVTGLGIADIDAAIGDDETVVLVGSSGAGKSSLINRLANNELRKTGPLGADGRGKHTTTSRELVLLDRYLVLDTPGMRELRLWDEDIPALDDTFAEVAELAVGCYYRNCTHKGERACAIIAAVESGTLAAERFEGWQRLTEEAAALEVRKEARLALEETRKSNAVSRATRLRDRRG